MARTASRVDTERLRQDHPIVDLMTLYGIELRTGSWFSKLPSCSGFTGEHRDYKGQVDVFLVRCPELNSVYEVRVAACGKQQMSLRIEQTKNGQAAYVRYAANYLVPAAGVEPALSLYESAALTVELGGPCLDGNADAMRALLDRWATWASVWQKYG